MVNLIKLFPLLLLILACNSDAVKQLDSVFTEPKIVINGYLSPEKIHLRVIQTTTPFKASSENDVVVENIELFLFDQNENLVSKIKQLDEINFFDTSLILQEGNSYKIRAKTPSYTSVETEWVTIPKKHNFDSISIKKVNIPINGSYSNQIYLCFNDVDTNSNYYVARLFNRKYGNNTNAVYFSKLENCFPLPVFSDFCFNTNSVALDISHDPFSYFKTDIEPSDSLILRFGLVDENYYQFIQEQREPDGFIEGVTEPSPTFSNVINGYGVVFGQNWADYYFKL